MRRLLLVTLLLFAVPAAIVFGTGANGGDGEGDYKVRAIFNNASFLIPGQDVKVAGAKVGTVEELDVTEDHKAAIVLKIERDGFKDFREDARCEIRLQSVIGEKLIECTPTQPRPEGEPPPPPLEEIPDGQPGAGQRLLPLESTITPIDADLINNIQRKPFRERFSILLSELGAGLAARAEDIQELIRRGDPALREFDEFLKILAGQNKMLRDLTADADRIFRGFARERKSVANFFVQSRVAAQATAENRRDFERNFAKFPAFLRELRPFMQRFDELSSEMAPVISDLRAAGPDVSRFMIALGPFSQGSKEALKTLGDAADVGRPALIAAEPIAERLSAFTTRARPVARNLQLLLTNLQERKGIERFMDLLFYFALSQNGFDEIGHYLRNALIVTVCSGYAITPTVGCSANFVGAEGAAASASANASSLATSRAAPGAIARGLIELIAGPDAEQKRREQRAKGEADRDGGSPPAEQPAVERQAAEEGPPAPAENGGEPKEEAAAGPAPDAPDARRPPSIQTQPNDSNDALLDYLLGGAQ